MERKMATIRNIDSIRPIIGADNIEVAKVGGWNVVVKRGDCAINQHVIFCEIDSWIPNTLAPFLTKAGHQPRLFEDVEGQRLRTVKLRGQISQGLILPVSELIEKYGINLVNVELGDDVSEILGIKKWEMPLAAHLQGQAKGTFPGFLVKTDQERIQNLFHELEFVWKNGDESWEVTEKLDGSSMTVYYLDGEVGVCSRNQELKIDDNNTTFVSVAKRDNLFEKLHSYGGNIALQGELVGPGIQGNRYNFKEHQFFVFDVYDIDSHSYVSPTLRQKLVERLDLQHVYVISSNIKFNSNTTVESILDSVSSMDSYYNPDIPLEGVVFKCQDKQVSFKVISNTFLLKEK